ncbi:MAG TPA: hypothetical protein VEJ87_05770 [Acidimicrobiales bacterium]|nr:hypothetical protein [Acidimicrobiales bacterium]
MTGTSTYDISSMGITGRVSPAIAVGRDGAFQLTDSTWRVLSRDAESGLSCGLLASRLSVEPVDRRSCRVAIEGLGGLELSCSIVLMAPARRVKLDLEERLVSLERSRQVALAIVAGEWWRSRQVFDDLDWSRRRSIAGVRYRSGWWGTGKLKPSMLAKVLDFGPNGVVLRGLRVRFLIPWDAIRSIGVAPGDAWAYGAPVTRHAIRVGSTIVLRSSAGQDAVFFTPLLLPSEVQAILEPFVASLEASDLDDRLDQAGSWGKGLGAESAAALPL